LSLRLFKDGLPHGDQNLKISDTIAEYKKQGKTFYSFEYFPPKTDFGLQNLYNRIDRMAALNPAFIDITWGAGGSTADLTFDMAKTVQQYFGLNVLMHLTCTNMPEGEIMKVLEKAKNAGVSNILALRGDPPEGGESWQQCQGGFNYAKDLVSCIRSTYGDQFCIGVAGYPEGHAEQPDIDIGIKHLKEKVDAGADLIITQLFYDIEKFLRFRDKAYKAGIRVPIIPGIMPIHNYSRFKKFAKFADISVPAHIIDDLEKIKNDDSKVMQFGIEQACTMSQQLIDEGVSGLHYYTLNLESSIIEILSKLGLSNAACTTKNMPWRQSSDSKRSSTEDVRPIYWSNRPVSYLTRTNGWDDYPNGRWGDSSSPTFCELNTYHVIRHAAQNEKINTKRKEVWGEPETEADVAGIFKKFCNGEISILPWCELPLAMESNKISESLSALNDKGYLTINSQPNLNGVKSEDPVHGWGDAGGRIYQKAYLEFFTSKKNLDKILDKLPARSSISLQAIRRDGDYINNLKSNQVTAVTWGVFPEKEIVQPTIVDSESFKIWKDEAFNLWLNEWAVIYSQDSASYNLLKEIHDSYYLVNIVDHDYVDGNIFSLFE
jgi:methylenetetrahydrofolate reductase (NADPH)